ncbi:MAG TPA: hypothetical protein VEG32_12145 [Clostridia bacterium]|nr:hypothetical protein [Clostridia bacterium]
MNEIISMVVQKAGISQDQARTAVETVVGALKSRLPESMASHLDSAVSGQGGGGAMGGLSDKLGGMLGQK